MSKEKHERIPLREVRELLYSPDDGPVIVTTRSRGFLMDSDMLPLKKGVRKRVVQLNGKEILNTISDRLRAHLVAKNLPTDKTVLAPIENPWAYTPEELAAAEHDDEWFEISRDSTAPLEEDRLAAELLHATTHLLANFDEAELNVIFRAMDLYHLHRSAGELNELAVEGKISRDNRAKGSQAKKSAAAAQRRLILSIARKFWEQHPKLEGQNLNTAKKIEEAVNLERKKQDPGCSSLAVKTISDQLRLALEEEGAQT